MASILFLGSHSWMFMSLCEAGGTLSFHLRQHSLKRGRLCLLLTIAALYSLNIFQQISKSAPCWPEMMGEGPFSLYLYVFHVTFILHSRQYSKLPSYASACTLPMSLSTEEIDPCLFFCIGAVEPVLLFKYLFSHLLIGHICTCTLMYSRLFYCPLKCHVKKNASTLMLSKIGYCILSLT